VQGYAYWEIGRLLGFSDTDRLMRGLSTSGLQELIYTRLGVNFNDLPVAFKRGRCIVPAASVPPSEPDSDSADSHPRWTVDPEIPRFNQDPRYIARFL
jgi:tRNA(His) 5'-end guanylyltransferase